MPGTYDLVNPINGSPFPLEVRDYVDVEGSGAGMTTIRGSLGYTVGFRYAGKGAELRALTVEGATTDPSARGIQVLATSATIRDVTVKSPAVGIELIGSNTKATDVLLDRVNVVATGSATSTGAYALLLPAGGIPPNVTVSGSTLVATGGNECNAVRVDGSGAPGNTVAVTNSTIRASGGRQITYGIFSRGEREVSLRGVSVSADGPFHVYGFMMGDNYFGVGGRARIDASEISASSTWQYSGWALQADVNSRILVGASRVTGMVPVGGAERYACAASYSGTYAPVNAACQPATP